MPRHTFSSSKQAGPVRISELLSILDPAAAAAAAAINEASRSPPFSKKLNTIMIFG